MKSRQFVRDYVVPAGGTLVRKDGDHHIFLLPSGRKLLVPMGGSQSEIAPYLVSKLRRLMRETPDEPEEESSVSAPASSLSTSCVREKPRDRSGRR